MNVVIMEMKVAIVLCIWSRMKQSTNMFINCNRLIYNENCCRYGCISDVICRHNGQEPIFLNAGYAVIRLIHTSLFTVHIMGRNLYFR